MFTCSLHLVMLYVLVYYWDLNVKGVGIASSVTHFLTIVICLSIVTFKKDIVHEESWHFFSRDSFKGFLMFLKFGVPSWLMIMIEATSFESMLIFAGMLGTLEQAANAICMGLTLMLFQVGLGLGLTAANKVGYYLGANAPEMAKFYTNVCILTTMIFSVIYLICLYFGRFIIVSVYTSNQELYKLTTEIFPLVAVFNSLLVIQISSSHVMRALGMQIYSTKVNIVCHWVISIPICYFLAFKAGWRLYGIWPGITLAVTLAEALYYLKIHFIDWGQLSNQFIERIQREKIELKNLNSDSDQSWNPSDCSI
jgi:multidrug resistance protein, MATE family